jgi:hypothetical protein
VVTDRVLPKKGEELTVTGYVESIEIGPERLIVLREAKKLSLMVDRVRFSRTYYQARGAS